MRQMLPHTIRSIASLGFLYSTLGSTLHAGTVLTMAKMEQIMHNHVWWYI